MDLEEIYPREVIRYISGEYSIEDEKFVHDWIAEDPARKEVLEELQTLWEASGGVLDLGNEARAWNIVKDEITLEKKTEISQQKSFPKSINRSSSSTLNRILKVAAILAVVAGAYSFYLYSNSLEVPSHTQEEVVYNTIVSQDNERVVVHIKDGTKAILNSSSQIRYRDDYGVSSRDIYLQGEAYFEVNHDHKKSFKVHTQDAVVEDIGTKFNVNTTKDKGGTEVVVAEGKVEVSKIKEESESNNTSDKLTSVVIAGGQKVNIDKKSDNFVVEKADLNNSLAWLQDKLIFDDEPLSQVIEELEDYYQINVTVADSTLLNKFLTGSFQNESIKNVAKVLAVSMDASYTLEDSTLYFFVNKRQGFNQLKQ